MNIDLEQALIELAKQITANQIPVQDRLWTSKEIAEYMSLSDFTVLQKVVVQPTFPTPTQPTGAAKRWFAGEVILWARQNRSKLPTGRTRSVKKAA
ncbi:hypothetical protein [Denitrificimonas caeni]|uniref:hypothetical protein n=1 Tax=Denitrificimonas caeni TaxID=521720 RepID=UPI001965A938|nr:hypothetical protein [Denitrificimonas caeni]